MRAAQDRGVRPLVAVRQALDRVAGWASALVWASALRSATARQLAYWLGVASGLSSATEPQRVSLSVVSALLLLRPLG